MEMFQAIIQANQGLSGRVQGVQYGIVATNNDPMRLGRIQVFDASKGGKSVSDWLIRILPFSGFSPPLPAIAETVLIGYVDGDPHNGVYFGNLQNAINPPINTGDDLVVQVGQVSLTIKPDGTVALTGVKSLSLDGGDFLMTNMENVKINGKSVLTIGSEDDDGDNNITKGW